MLWPDLRNNSQFETRSISIPSSAYSHLRRDSISWLSGWDEVSGALLFQTSSSGS